MVWWQGREEVKVPPYDEIAIDPEKDEIAIDLEKLFAAPFDPEAITVDPITGKEIVSNQIIVGFKEGVAKATKEKLIAELGSVIVGQISVLEVYQLKIPDNTLPSDLVIQFKKSPYVEWAEVNYITHSFGSNKSASVVNPNDPYFNRQWALDNIGQTGGQ